VQETVGVSSAKSAAALATTAAVAPQHLVVHWLLEMVCVLQI